MYRLMKDPEEDDFEILLNEKRHKELIDILKKILVNLTQKSDTTNIEAILKKVASNSDDSTPKSIELIGEAIINKIKEINTPQVNKEWKFVVNRNNNGFITDIIAR